jgi:hypothetical protein
MIMQLNKNIFKLATVMALVLFLSLALFGANAQAEVVDFDAVDASGGPVDATSYLAGYGITLTDLTPGSPGPVIMDARNSNWLTTSTPNNFFTVFGPGPNYMKYTMNFAVPVNNFSFDFIGITSPTTIPEWKATAYDASGTALSSVGEALHSVWSTILPQTFTLNGEDIKYIIFESDAQGFAAMGSPNIDTFSYTPTPIPGAIWLLGSGLLGLGAVGWRRQQV